MPGGEDGDEIVGEMEGTGLLLGEGGGVLDPVGEGTRGGLPLLGCLGTLGPGPELSDGVGGSPLLHAMEQ